MRSHHLQYRRYVARTLRQQSLSIHTNMLATSALLLFMGVHSPAVAQTEANLTTGVRDFSIQTRSFTAADGDVKDGCITPGGPYKLLRFDFDAKNQGKADVTIGPPPAAGQSNAIYVWSAAHGHHHVRDFNNYELVNDSSVTVRSGFKQAFCLMDSEKLYPGADPAKLRLP